MSLVAEECRVDGTLELKPHVTLCILHNGLIFSWLSPDKLHETGPLADMQPFLSLPPLLSLSFSLWHIILMQSLCGNMSTSLLTDAITFALR